MLREVYTVDCSHQNSDLPLLMMTIVNFLNAMLMAHDGTVILVNQDL